MLNVLTTIITVNPMHADHVHSKLLQYNFCLVTYNEELNQLG